MIELSPIIVFELAGGERFILLRLGSIVNHYHFLGLSEEWFNKIDIIISIIVYLVSMVIYKKINIIISIIVYLVSMVIYKKINIIISIIVYLVSMVI
jgi:hypothetical protein